MLQLKMKFNPLTNELFTDGDRLLKKLHCPILQQWEAMTEAIPAHKICDRCSKAVYDTAFLSEANIQELVTNNAQACLKVDLNQDNLTITYTNHG